jgi:hypothetical protein
MSGECGASGYYTAYSHSFFENALHDLAIEEGKVRQKRPPIKCVPDAFIQLVVHEWGHLRYGVFDEYPLDGDQKFYFAGNGWEAVRCSLAIKGTKDNTTTTDVRVMLLLKN